MSDQPQAMPPERISLVRDEEYAEWLVAAASDDPKYPQFIRADIAEARQSEQSARIRLFADAGRRLSKCTEAAQLKREAAGLFSLIGLNGTPFEAVIDGQQARIKALEDALRAICYETTDRGDLEDAIDSARRLLEQPK